MHIGLNAHLLSNAAGYRSAGIRNYIHSLLTHLPAAAPPDWRFTALVGAQSDARIPGMTFRRAQTDTESPQRRIAWEQLAQPWQLADFDLYHALAFVAPLILARPSVVTIYDLSFIHYPERLPAARRLYLRLFTGLTCRRARRVIAISHSTARDLTATLGIPPEKIDVAAPGCDPQIFKPLADAAITAFRRAKNLPERFWLFIGTLEPRKNLPTLLDAYAALPERLPLVIGGGKGWQYDDIFAAVERHGLKNDVHFAGFVANDELAFWYNSADAFVYPSVFEGFGLPVLEAMACGTPVIVSDASSFPEVAGDAGICVPPHDVPAWTAALNRALHDSEWREQAREPGLQSAARFTWEATAKQTIACYSRAL